MADDTECAIGQFALDDVTVPCLDTCDMLDPAVVAHDRDHLCWVSRQRLYKQLKAVVRPAVQLGGWSPSPILGMPKLVCPFELVYAAYLAGTRRTKQGLRVDTYGTAACATSAA